MEIGNERVGDADFVRREDEFVGPALEFLDFVGGGHKGLQPAEYGDANGHHPVPAALGLVDLLCGLGRDNERL